MANVASKERRAGPGSDGASRSGAPPDPFEPDPNIDDSVDIGQLVATVRSSIPFILGFAAFFYAIVMFSTMMAHMTFRSSGRLYLGELEVKSKPGTNPSELDFSGGGQGDVGSELEILRSQSFVTQAILDAGLNVTVIPRGWTAPRNWQWLLSKRDPRVLERPMAELSAVGTSLTSSGSTQRFGVKFVSADVYDIWGREGRLGRGKLGVPLTVKGLRITLLPGLEPDRRPRGEYEIVVDPLNETADKVLDTLQIVAPKAAGAGEAAKVVTLSFVHTSPQSAANFLRKLMLNYLEERQAWKSEDATAAENFVKGQLRSLRESLDRTESKLADYRKNTRVVTLDSESKAMIEQMGKYEEQRVASRLQVGSLMDMKRALKDPNPPAEAFMFGEVHDTVLAEMSEALTNVRRMLRDAEQQFGANAPQTRQLKGQVSAQLDVIRNYVTSRLVRAQNSLSSMNGIIAQFEEKLKTVPGAELGLAQLEREAEVYNRVYSYMLERQQQAAITKASTISKNRILDLPQAAYREDAPRLGLRLASGLLFLVLGALVVIARRFFAVSFQSENEVQKAAGRLPIFGHLPARTKATGTSKATGEAWPIYDVLADDPTSPFVEALRMVRTNLYYWSKFDHGRVVLLTSPQPNDGKTTTVLSLAAILAGDGKRVLVVDADLRKPSHHHLFGTPPHQGLRGVLSGQCEWTEAVRRVQLSHGSFDSIGAGKLTPSELLSGERTARFIDAVRYSYDFVLLDAPSYPLVADSIILAAVADCVLTVIRLRSTDRKLAAEHMRRLWSSAPKYGIVVNDTENAGTPYPAPAKKALFRRIGDSLAGLLRWPQGKSAAARRKRWIAIWIVVCLGTLELAVLEFVTDDHFDFKVARRATGKSAEVVPVPASLPRPSSRVSCSPSTPGSCKPSSGRTDGASESPAIVVPSNATPPAKP